MFTPKQTREYVENGGKVHTHTRPLPHVVFSIKKEYWYTTADGEMLHTKQVIKLINAGVIHPDGGMTEAGEHIYQK